MLVPCAYIYKGPIATTSRSRCPLQKPTASSADCWRNQAFAMETKVVCLTLAFLVLAMEINAVPVGPSDLVEDSVHPRIDKRSFKMKNPQIWYIQNCYPPFSQSGVYQAICRQRVSPHSGNQVVDMKFYLGNDINYERIRESTTSIETL
ncbi:uncharacterized protein LOC111136836 isoform X2 [Crassostrea virginica]